ncbi:MAG: DUF2306 domain-containing protein [Pseudomonadota bacterium]
MNTLVSQPFRTLLWVMTAILALAYIPFASEYMLQYFTAAAPQWQNQVLAHAVSEDFAYGPGSIAATQHAHFINHRVAMLLHTVPGSLALLLCIAQFSTRLRQRYLNVHRLIGRMTMLLVLVSMLAGAVFLLQATPDQSRLGGFANTALLWGLDLTTLTAMVLAFVAICRKDIQAHRAFVILMFTMLTTTPLLRYGWLVVAWFVPTADQLTAQNLAAIFLVTAAPGFAMVALAMSDGFNRSMPATMMAPPLACWLTRLLPVVALVGMAVLCLRMNGMRTGYNMEIFIAQALPWALSWLVITALLRRARRLGQAASVQHLQVFSWSIALLPVGVNIGWSLFGLFMADSAEAYMTVAMLGAGGSMYIAYFWIVLHDATFWRRSTQQG